MNVPFVDLELQHKMAEAGIKEAISRVLESKKFILGEEVSKFEDEVKTYTGYKYAVGVSSGTDALIASLMALGVGPGDEVITTPFSFIATSHAIIRVGAEPVFVDIDPHTYMMDLSKVEEAISIRTKAIIPVSLFGCPFPVDDLSAMVSHQGIFIIEDAAQSFSPKIHTDPLCICCYSFFPTKVLGGCGDGGMVVTNDPFFDKALREVRSQGARSKNFHSSIGGNFRLDALQAAILSAKMSHLYRWLEMREAIANAYNNFLAKPLSSFIQTSTECLSHTHSQYVISAKNRDTLKKYLDNNGIRTEIYYPIPIHLQPCYVYLEYMKGDFPEAESASDTVLALPIYPGLIVEQQRYVIETIVDFYTKI